MIGDRSALLDQHGAEVVDVGEGRAGDKKVADAVEEGPRVVVGEHGFGVEARCLGALQRVRRDDGAGIVLRTVDAVGVSGQSIDTRHAIERDGERAQELGVAPAFAFALQCERRLAA